MIRCNDSLRRAHLDIDCSSNRSGSEVHRVRSEPLSSLPPPTRYPDAFSKTRPATRPVVLRSRYGWLAEVVFEPNLKIFGQTRDECLRGFAPSGQVHFRQLYALGEFIDRTIDLFQSLVGRRSFTCAVHWPARRVDRVPLLLFRCCDNDRHFAGSARIWDSVSSIRAASRLTS